jgi:arabinogalactan endo-1,4-beta-galactosidase
VLHLTNINAGVDGLTWWFDEVSARGVPFDLIGLSYYSYWHGSLADLQGAVSTLSERYDRDVLIVETSYPWTLADDPDHVWENVVAQASMLTPGYPATPEGQAANFRAVQDVVAAAPGGRGIGVVAWEPTWTAGGGPRRPPPPSCLSGERDVTRDGGVVEATRTSWGHDRGWTP